MDRCEEDVGELEELITLDVLNHYLYKVLIIMIIFMIIIIIANFHTLCLYSLNKVFIIMIVINIVIIKFLTLTMC